METKTLELMFSVINQHKLLLNNWKPTLFKNHLFSLLSQKKVLVSMVTEVY
jgi:hypothetical protein